MSLFRGISSRRAPTCTFPNLVCSHANRMGKISFQSRHEEHPDVFAELKCTCTRGCLLQQLPGSLGKAMLTATKWCREQHGAKKLQGRGCWTSHQTCGFGSQLCIFLAGGLDEALPLPALPSAELYLSMAASAPPINGVVISLPSAPCWAQLCIH